MTGSFPSPPLPLSLHLPQRCPVETRAWARALWLWGSNWIQGLDLFWGGDISSRTCESRSALAVFVMFGVLWEGSRLRGQNMFKESYFKSDGLDAQGLSQQEIDRCLSFWSWAGVRCMVQVNFSAFPADFLVTRVWKCWTCSKIMTKIDSAQQEGQCLYNSTVETRFFYWEF